MNKILKTSLISLSILSLPSISMAEGGYLGLGVGQASNDACDLVAGADTFSCEDSKTVFKVLGGYSFNENFAIEGGFNSLGEAHAEDSASPTRLKLEGDAIHLGIVGTAPLSENFALFGKVGAARWNADASATDSTGATGKAEDDGFDAMYSAGIKWIHKDYSLRLEYERYEVSFDDFEAVLGDNADADIISLTYTFSF